MKQATSAVRTTQGPPAASGSDGEMPGDAQAVTGAHSGSCCAEARQALLVEIAELARERAACYPIEAFPPLSTDFHQAEGAATRLALLNFAALIAERFGQK